MIVECDPTVEYLKTVFMDEISGPSPQTEIAVQRAAKAAKRARKALKQANKKVTKQAEKGKYTKGDDEQMAIPEGPAEVTNTVEEMPQLEQLEDKDKPQRQKEKRRKRKEELDVPPQSEVRYGDPYKHKKRRVESDAQDVNSRQSKTKKRSPQSSPFFRRSSLTEAKKDVNRKVNQLMNHEPSGSIPKKNNVAIDEAKTLVDFSTPMI